jgi:Putative heavy-metal-binding
MSTPFGRKPTAGAGGVEPRWVTTANDFDGYRIAEYRGVVRGIVVRSRSVLGNIGASVQTFFGGNITLYPDLCERARQDAYALMLRHATEAAPCESIPAARHPSAPASRTRSRACA